MILYLVLIHNIANAVVFPFADPLGKGLRAAGDAMFTMGISLVTTIGVDGPWSDLLDPFPPGQMENLSGDR